MLYWAIASALDLADIGISVTPNDYNVEIEQQAGGKVCLYAVHINNVNMDKLGAIARANPDIEILDDIEFADFKLKYGIEDSPE